MSNFTEIRDRKGCLTAIKTSLKGENLLLNPRLNKGTAFSLEERLKFRLLGKLPSHIETLEEQSIRFYEQYKEKPRPFDKHIYLDRIHNENETLFFKLVGDHLDEMLPIVYTPTIGEAVMRFSRETRRPQGIFMSYEQQDDMDEILAEVETDDIDLIVVTDGEAILGIGDQGVGGIDICIGKLAVYTLCAGINPHRVLPIQLDVGTNNEEMLSDPMYLGLRRTRITGKAYDDFIDRFVRAVLKRFPNVFLHWEDFAKNSARKNLERYRHEICTFNDDMQGTGAVTVSALLKALDVTGANVSDQRIVFFGAGTASTGIADQLCAAMVREGLSQEEASARVCLLGRHGLLVEGMQNLSDFQMPYVKSHQTLSDWDLDTTQENIDLFHVVKNFKPTILIGCSTVGGAFTREIVQEMAKHTKRPIIFSLSNPTAKAEANPHDLLEWTNGQALIATGSPFPETTYNGKHIEISQCNNAFIFPGIGLGILAVKPKLLTDTMIWAACEALTKYTPKTTEGIPLLLPRLDQVKAVSLKIAQAVAKKAISEGLAEPVDIDEAIQSVLWEPRYYGYQD